MYNRLAAWNKKIKHKNFDIYKNKEKQIAKSLRERLWNGKYFADWNDYKKQNYFYPFGNCLAVAWGLTTENESKKILEECQKVKFNFTLETNSPKYPPWRIDPLQQLICMGNYQNKSTLWWQPVAAYLAALKKTAKIDEFNYAANKIGNKIISDGKVYECYNRKGKPLNKLVYKAERPFAWASGMLLWALRNETSSETN